MARIVLGIGTSHTPMLNAKLEDWPRFVELDRPRAHRDKEGRPVGYDDLVAMADPSVLDELRPEVLADRHARATEQVERLGRILRSARLDSLIVIGDDQKELYHDDNMPSILIYRGETIRNVPLKSRPGPEWAKQAAARYYEPESPRDYPVDTALAEHLISSLVAAEFDIACANTIDDGKGEGHAFAFVHTRLLQRGDLPVVPVFLNTYYPPNQPTPARCHRLGQAIRAAVERFPGDARIGVIASGGLSHFTVDEALDAEVIDALRSADAERLGRLPLAKLVAGSSEIRNWICMAGAVEHLKVDEITYIPAYRTPAGTGTGLCFANWH